MIFLLKYVFKLKDFLWSTFQNPRYKVLHKDDKIKDHKAIRFEKKPKQTDKTNLVYHKT